MRTLLFSIIQAVDLSGSPELLLLIPLSCVGNGGRKGAHSNVEVTLDDCLVGFCNHAIVHVTPSSGKILK